MKKLSVIILCYNSGKFIKQTLNSVFDNLPKDSEVIVLDNRSTDDTKQVLEKYPGIKFIENIDNLGFSKGNNIGARNAQGEYLFFLNPDTKIKSGAIQNLLDYAKEHPSVGIVAPILLEDEKIQQSVGNLPSLLRVIQEFCLGQKNTYSQFAPKGDNPQEVEVVYGAAMLIKKDVFDAVGGFDERYFLYYEDIQLCKNIKEKGLNIIWDPSSKVEHLVGASMPASQKLSFPLSVIQHFYPIKQSGSYYYLIQSSIIYFGFVQAFLIHLIIFLFGRLRK